MLYEIFENLKAKEEGKLCHSVQVWDSLELTAGDGVP